MTDRLHGKTALITAAAQGIGRATAEMFAAEGAQVHATDINGEKLAELGPVPGITTHVLDVTDNEAVDALPVNLPEGWREIDFLINNAGHEVGGRKRFDEGSADEWAAILETNVLGMFRISRAIVPGMVARGQGHVVNIGSTSGLVAGATRTAYAASKHAVHGFSKSLRLDYAGSGIRVSEIMPGIVRTDFAEARSGDAEKAKKFYDSFDDSMEPDDIAEAIIYALSQPARVNVAQIVLMQSSMK